MTKSFFVFQDISGDPLSMGPLKMAAMNGLSTSRGSVLEPHVTDESRAPKDERVSEKYFTLAGLKSYIIDS